MLIYDLCNLICGTFYVSGFQLTFVVIYVNNGLQITGTNTACFVNDHV
ncbi:hypothetical protein EVA_12025 [gut metagenome]|uniref:Uncharacterized protein n=1 Tax=gut metagenome TaxID=749906 RepID=J9GDL4_9ZZZZ